MISRDRRKESCLNIIRYWGRITMCIWLGLYWLGVGVGASGDGLQTSVNTQPALPSSAEMLATLKKIGFVFTVEKPQITVERYVSIRLSEPAAAHNSIGTNPPLYVVRYAGLKKLQFTAPVYENADAAMEALNELRKIAIIKTMYCYVLWKPANPELHQINQLILNRVYNVLDCCMTTLCASISLERLEYTSLVDLEACKREALNTIEHAAYGHNNTLDLCGELDGRLPSLITSGIFLWRPLTTVRLLSNAVHDVHLLSQLRLTNDYSLGFAQLPKSVNIDLRVLQTLPYICNAIDISEAGDAKVTLSGLENAIDKHTQIVLKADWDTLLYLAVNNGSDIRVHTIMGLVVELKSLQAMIKADRMSMPDKPRVFATIILSQINSNMPCGPVEQYHEFYNPDTFIKYGIRVDDVQLYYKGGRTDLHATLTLLCSIGALPNMPDEVDETITCNGTDINGIDLEVQGTVEICLDHARLGRLIHEYISQNCMCFCQNIRYTEISITEGEDPRPEEVNILVGKLLSLFHNITAQCIRIWNVHGQHQTTTNFDLNTFKTNANGTEKLLISVDCLFLDNVDPQILYWMLGNYIFTEPTEVHILNQSFANLAVVQVLTLPELSLIKTLVIDDCSDLNELVNYKKPAESEEFSLFRYIEENQREGKSIESLGLHKLSLQLEESLFELHYEALHNLWSYGIIPMGMPFEIYIAWSTAPSLIGLCKKEFILSSVTVVALNADFANCQAMLLNQSNQGQTLEPQEYSIQKNSVEKLVMLFSNGQTLTETDLATIIRWVSCRFTDLTILQLCNLELSANDHHAIASRDYCIRGLDKLTSIQIEDISSRPHTYIELIIRPYHISLLATATNLRPEFTAVSHATLSRLFSQGEQLKTLVPTNMGTKASLEMIKKHLLTNQKTKKNIECSICYDKLFVSTVDDVDGDKCLKDEENKDDADGEPSAKKPRNESTVPETKFTTLCYFKCGHTFCDRCAVNWFDEWPSKNCPECREEGVYLDIHYLVGVPLSNFVVLQDNINTNPLSINCQYLKDLACHDGYIYFYIAYNDIIDLSTELGRKATYDDPHQLYVI
ncbi:hypothetical protein NEHOM01_1015 [Nematocida homosporus]|uniref:uncharacterized protein n=1 Tax=Nematocida homosporus TaxID=1912981 RepID=UPI002220266A|nr:uncharacterized protein NEHOM01_1015 [Nematocida homosporus]KAI5185723.1 hypothetical protein NEHOM01_1015 [Nematocida homosporus]